MEQAKWYKIRFHYIPIEDHGDWNFMLKQRFKWLVFIQCLKNDDLKRTRLWMGHIETFCGRKKLNNVIKEAHLLGLEDELLIFERRASNA